jgi:hypothetical protein
MLVYVAELDLRTTATVIYVCMYVCSNLLMQTES